uniref:WD40 repeat n=1 Tax=Candidatus Kentrum sp. FW TaxID=2126338 RepID=A0A450TWT5_9GAMM|nr:MAG: WD40 repeat [Candidatus Kentron sp. FW]
MTFQYDLFLSYARKDKKAIHALARRLKNDGLRVWLDVWGILPGDSIPLKIQRGVENARTLVMCMSPAYFDSEWGKLEHHSILFRDPTNAQRRFIPLLIADCQPPDIIAQFAHIDWREGSETEYQRLLAACRPKSEKPETGTSTETPSVPDSQIDRPRMVLKGHDRAVWCVAVTPDGRTVVSGSSDDTLKVWELETGRLRATLEGHMMPVTGVVVTPDGQQVISSSFEGTLRVWSLKTGRCIAVLDGIDSPNWGLALSGDGRTLVSGSTNNTLGVWDLETGRMTKLKGHTDDVRGVAITRDANIAVSGSNDCTLRVWDLETGQCLYILEGHTGPIDGVAITPDAKILVSGSDDKTLKVWDMATGQCRATFEGHTDYVNRVAITPDGQRVVSASHDKTVKVWELATGRCLATLRGHTGSVFGLAITPDGKQVISSSDKTLRVWDLPTPDVTIGSEATRYTNAKVVLVGESGVGKTGLALRLCRDRWEATESTHGMEVERLALPSSTMGVPMMGTPMMGTPMMGTALRAFAHPTGVDDLEREVWLWDFAGQPDYRLIHQLYMDETALGLLVFDPQDDNPFESIGYWDKALGTASEREPAKLLVAGRCDRGGITISHKRFQEYVRKQGFAGFLTTGAKTGEGCEELKTAIAQHIPWDRLPWTATSRLFKTLKDAILRFTESDTPLARLSELRQRLQLTLPEEDIDEAELRAVVGLMQGQGVVQMLGFGDFALLQPEWINRYAAIVVRMAREHADEMGVVPEQRVLAGDLDYKDMARLGGADEEVLLRAMVRTFLERALCIQEKTPQGNLLVFPSYFRRDKPDLPEHPNVFVTYRFSGPLDEIYATLVVRLSYSEMFENDELWKDAADFRTPEGRRVGLAMHKKAEGAAEIVVYFEAETPEDTKVTFIKYVHEHLLAKARPRESVTRARSYICPHCDEPIENARAIEIRLKKGLKDIVCPVCEGRVPLFDLIEEKFASDKFQKKVRELDEQAGINLDNGSKELVLTGHAMAIAGEAGQIYRITAQPDWGIDAEIEFKNDKGQASGKRVYLQLKSGDSYLYRRQGDGAEVFTIRKRRQAEYWLAQAYPVMLVIRGSDGNIRWMNVSEYLRDHGADTKRVVFEGEMFTAANVVGMRNRVLGGG